MMEPKYFPNIDSAERELLESSLYSAVENFLKNIKNCEEIGSAGSLSLDIFGSTIFPDVFGVVDPQNDESILIMAEGKRSIRGRNFDICKGQGLTLQRFADYVYLFFPIEPWNKLLEKEQKQIMQECSNVKLGLLVVDKERCLELVQPQVNVDLLENEKKASVKNEISKYFPNYAQSSASVNFISISRPHLNRPHLPPHHQNHRPN